jgi:hypothetical protein
MAVMPSSRAVLGVAGAVAAVSAVTGAVLLGAVTIGALAGMPRDVAAGKVWLPFTSALVADRPVALSLVAFALFAFAALAVCGARVVAVSAAVGHVGSTLVVYLALAAVRAVDPGAFENAVTHRDYGVSAMIAAWLGAIVLVQWRRRPSRRVLLVAFVGVCAAVGWFADSQRTPLDADHVVAFAFGAAIAARSVLHAHEVQAPGRRSRSRLLARPALEQARQRVGRLLDHRADERADHVA